MPDLAFLAYAKNKFIVYSNNVANRVSNRHREIIMCLK